MQESFTLGSIVSALFGGITGGVAAYVLSYAQAKGQLRAATEDLKQAIENLSAMTHAEAIARAKVAEDLAAASDLRRAICNLATSSQSLIHSMLWLSWDARERGRVRVELTKMYDEEAHKLIPEIFGQLALLRLLDLELHGRAYPYAERLTHLDVEFGLAIVASESDGEAAVRQMGALHDKAYALQLQIGALFGGDLQITTGDIANTIFADAAARGPQRS